jgi:hypothetical protein
LKVQRDLGAPINLLNAVTVSGGYTNSLVGGTYIWSATSTGWNGATATLVALGDDGVTDVTVTTLTANGSKKIDVGEASKLKVVISAAVPSAGVYSNISRTA